MTDRKKESVTRNIRLPALLLAKIQEVANEKKWSVNACIVNILEEKLVERLSK